MNYQEFAERSRKIYDRVYEAVNDPNVTLEEQKLNNLIREARDLLVQEVTIPASESDMLNIRTTELSTAISVCEGMIEAMKAERDRV